MLFNRYPIVVFSTPRVGSTAISQFIRSKCSKNLEYFFEPDYLESSLKDFTNHFTKSKEFILKLHYYALEKYNSEIKDYICSNPEVFKIRLRRKDFINQVASLYTAHTRNLPLARENKKWHYIKGIDSIETTTNELIEIKEQRIKDVIQFLAKVNKDLNETSIEFDLDLYYEDIVQDLSNTTVFITPKPKNYDELIYKINSLYSAL